MPPKYNQNTKTAGVDVGIKKNNNRIKNVNVSSLRCFVRKDNGVIAERWFLIGPIHRHNNNNIVIWNECRKTYHANRTNR